MQVDHACWLNLSDVRIYSALTLPLVDLDTCSLFIILMVEKCAPRLCHQKERVIIYSVPTFDLCPETYSYCIQALRLVGAWGGRQGGGCHH